MKELIKKLKSSQSLSPEAEAYLFSISKQKTYAKGEILIREGQKVNKIFFVKDGCLRSYCIDKNGKEHTLQFAINGWWISDYIANYNDAPAILTIECLKETTVVEFNAEKLNEILIPFPEFEPFKRNTLEQHIVSLHKRILNQLIMTAAERYALFIEKYPDIEQYTRCLLYTSPSPRDATLSRMPSSA